MQTARKVVSGRNDNKLGAGQLIPNYSTYTGEGCLLESPPNAVHRVDASAGNAPVLYKQF